MADFQGTVPKADTPAPPDNAKETLIGDGSGMYARPTAGGNAAGGTAIGGSSDAPPGETPTNPVTGGVPNAPPDGSLSSAMADENYHMAEAGAPSSTGGTQVGPDFGHGATIILSGISGGGDTDNDGDTL